MRYRIISLCLFLLLIIFISNSQAQTLENDNWNKIITIQGGFLGSGAGWSHNIPFYFYGSDPPGVIVESADMKYKAGAIINGGFELSKRYIGFQANFGYTPTDIDLNASVTNLVITNQETLLFDSTTYYFEGAFLVFPTGKGTENISPYLSFGAGGCKLYTDNDWEKRNYGGYLISYGGGVRIFSHEKYGINIGVKGLYMNYGNVEDLPKELTFKPFQITCGFLYCF